MGTPGCSLRSIIIFAPSSASSTVAPNTKPTGWKVAILSAGRGVANPLAQILSVAMLLTYALDMGEQAAWIESAVARVLDEGWRTRDIADVNTPADKILGTTTMGDKVVAAL